MRKSDRSYPLAAHTAQRGSLQGSIPSSPQPTQLQALTPSYPCILTTNATYRAQAGSSPPRFQPSPPHPPPYMKPQHLSFPSDHHQQGAGCFLGAPPAASPHPLIPPLPPALPPLLSFKPPPTERRLFPRPLARQPRKARLPSRPRSSLRKSERGLVVGQGFQVREACDAAGFRPMRFPGTTSAHHHSSTLSLLKSSKLGAQHVSMVLCALRALLQV